MNKRGNPGSCEGIVTSDKMDKTVVVEVQRTITHPLYRKVMRRSNKLKAHDEGNQCRIGDRVLLRECRPLSKDKSWQVVEVLTRAE